MTGDRADYSGDFDPDIRYADFSKGFLLDLLEAYARYMHRVDALWYLTVKARHGDADALACDGLVWEKAIPFELEMARRLYKIEGDDVAAMAKALQVRPVLRIKEFTVDLRDDNHAVFTVTRCPTLEGLEKEGEGRERNICSIIEPQVLRTIADFFNPRIGIRSLRLPPREDTDDICCRWELSLNDWTQEGR